MSITEELEGFYALKQHEDRERMLTIISAIGVNMHEFKLDDYYPSPAQSFLPEPFSKIGLQLTRAQRQARRAHFFKYDLDLYRLFILIMKSSIL